MTSPSGSSICYEKDGETRITSPRKSEVRGPRSPQKSRCTCFQDVTKRCQSYIDSGLWIGPKQCSVAQICPFCRLVNGTNGTRHLKGMSQNVSKFTASSFYTPFLSEFHTFAITSILCLATRMSLSGNSRPKQKLYLVGGLEQEFFIFPYGDGSKPYPPGEHQNSW
jgi:hypothetical protein